jgi:predicted Zn-ribbon and HTH transcriptional regulator
MLSEKIVILNLKPEIAKWVEKLSEMTGMSDEDVVEGSLYLLRLATSTELGRFYVAQALKACGFFDDENPFNTTCRAPKGYNLN